MLSFALAERSHGKPGDETTEEAIRHAEQALAVLVAQGASPATAQIDELLAVLHQQTIRGSRADNLERARDHLQQLLAGSSKEQDSYLWRLVNTNLAAVYGFRRRGDPADNIEQAILHGEQALSGNSPDVSPESWATVTHGLAIAYLERLRGDRGRNIEVAISLLKRVLTVRTRQDASEKWAEEQLQMGIAYNFRIQGDEHENLEQAMSHFRAGLEVTRPDRSPLLWARLQGTLGITWYKRALGELEENVEQGIAHIETALEIFARQAAPFEWAIYQNHLGNAYARRARGDAQVNVDEAVRHYRLSLEVCTREADPANYLGTLGNIGDLSFERRRFTEAEAAYAEAISVNEDLLISSYTDAGREAVVDKIANMYSRSADCLLRLGKPAEAFLRLEAGRTRLLRQLRALEGVLQDSLDEDGRRRVEEMRSEIRRLEGEMRVIRPFQQDHRLTSARLRKLRGELTDLLGRMQGSHGAAPSLSQLLASIPAGGALVVPLYTTQGSAVFVVPHGRRDVTCDDIIVLDEERGHEVSELVFGTAEKPGWLHGYAHTRGSPDAPAWLAGLEQVCERSFSVLMGPVHERLRQMGLAEGSPVVLMSPGGLNLLPLHAASHEVDGERRAFLDDYSVSYAASLTLLSARADRRPRVSSPPSTPRLLAVVNPRQNLRYADAEGWMITRHFDASTVQVLRGAEVTKDTLLRHAPSCPVLHFACHATYDWGHPLRSGLEMAGDQTLTLAEIFAELDLRQTELVVLSACDSGIADFQRIPDEYLGLPVALLQAGAAAVVSSLWAVDDLSTMLLMDRFYHYMMSDRIPPAAALRQAQLWLRGSTAEELTARFAAERRSAGTDGALSYETASAAWRWFAAQEPHSRPFEHPKH